MIFTVYHGLDVLFLASVLYIIGASKKFTPTAKSLLLIPVSFLAGDLLISLDYPTDLVEMGYTAAWVFFAILLAYFHTVAKGKPKKEVLNLGGAVLFSPVLLLINKNASFPLLLCYGIGVFAFSNFLVDDIKEIRASGALGLIACALFLVFSLGQIIELPEIDEAVSIAPRVILLASLAIFGRTALTPKKNAHARVPEMEIGKAFPTVIKLKEERRAIHSQAQAMLTELKRLKKDKSSRVDGVYESLRKEYAKEVSLLNKTSSRKLKDMKQIEKQLEREVTEDKKELAELRKSLDEEVRTLQKVSEVLSKEKKKEK